MFAIHSGSFAIADSEIYTVLVGYLSLPPLPYWNGIDGDTLHQHENGWTIKSTSNIHLERVDRISNGDIEVAVTWIDFNAKEIADIEVTFYKDIYLSLHSDIIDELYLLDVGCSDSDRDMSILYPMKASLVHTLEQKIRESEYSSTLMIQYKTIIEQIEEDYFSAEGLCSVARRFGVAC